jgi:hypothetical protein
MYGKYIKPPMFVNNLKQGFGKEQYFDLAKMNFAKEYQHHIPTDTTCSAYGYSMFIFEKTFKITTFNRTGRYARPCDPSDPEGGVFHSYLRLEHCSPKKNILQTFFKNFILQTKKKLNLLKCHPNFRIRQLIFQVIQLKLFLKKKKR